jgi:hypothetical protein
MRLSKVAGLQNLQVVATTNYMASCCGQILAGGQNGFGVSSIHSAYRKTINKAHKIKVV